MNQNTISTDPIGSLHDLKLALQSIKAGVIKIKPRLLFSKIEDGFKGPVDLRLHIPSSGIGSITLLEAAALVSVLNLQNPKKVFEFGTFLGYSTALFLRNTSNDCQVYSIDLGSDVSDYQQATKYSEKELRSDDKKNDDYLRLVQGTQGPMYLRGLDSSQQSRLNLLYGDSTRFDIGAHGLKGAVDFVFVDGGHDTATIKSDTEKSVEMIGQDGVIFWHDYDSKIHSDVTDFVQEYASQGVVFHVENTMLACRFYGKALETFLS